MENRQRRVARTRDRKAIISEGLMTAPHDQPGGDVEDSMELDPTIDCEWFFMDFYRNANL